MRRADPNARIRTQMKQTINNVRLDLTSKNTEWLRKVDITRREINADNTRQ